MSFAPQPPEPPKDYRWLVMMTLACLAFYVCLGILLTYIYGSTIQ